jgi:hypothetical protein
VDIIKAIQYRMITLAGHVGCTEEIKESYRILFGKPEGKRSYW